MQLLRTNGNSRSAFRSSSIKNFLLRFRNCRISKKERLSMSNPRYSEITVALSKTFLTSVFQRKAGSNQAVQSSSPYFMAASFRNSSSEFDKEQMRSRAPLPRNSKMVGFSMVQISTIIPTASVVFNVDVCAEHRNVHVMMELINHYFQKSLP